MRQISEKRSERGRGRGKEEAENKSIVGGKERSGNSMAVGIEGGKEEGRVGRIKIEEKARGSKGVNCEGEKNVESAEQLVAKPFLQKRA